jgi:hypothetical protein
MTKRGQVTIFVIIAVVIVGAILIYFAFPKTRAILPGSSPPEPNAYLRDCLSPIVSSSLKTLSSQGGDSKPTNYAQYKGQKIEFLCYTSEDYKPCIVQQPLLVSHIESELKDSIEPTARECMSALKQLYESKGYVITSSSEIDTHIEPGKISVEYTQPVTISKDTTQTFRKAGYSKASNMYDLLMTATSIIQFESTLGNSETSLYIQYYPDLNIEKMKRESDTIYTLTNVVSKESFRFATRSLIWPAGFGSAS